MSIKQIGKEWCVYDKKGNYIQTYSSRSIARKHNKALSADKPYSCAKADKQLKASPRSKPVEASKTASPIPKPAPEKEQAFLAPFKAHRDTLKRNGFEWLIIDSFGRTVSSYKGRDPMRKELSLLNRTTKKEKVQIPETKPSVKENVKVEVSCTKHRKIQGRGDTWRVYADYELVGTVDSYEKAQKAMKYLRTHNSLDGFK